MHVIFRLSVLKTLIFLCSVWYNWNNYVTSQQNPSAASHTLSSGLTCISFLYAVGVCGDMGDCVVDPALELRWFSAPVRHSSAEK